LKIKHISLGLLVILFICIIYQCPFGSCTEANFYAISESDNPTHWILQGTDLTPLEDFHDDISGSNWNLYGVSESTFNKNDAQSVNYLLDGATTSSIWGYSGYNFYIGTQDTSPEGIYWDGSYFRMVGGYHDSIYKYTINGAKVFSWFYVGDEDTTPRGICWDGTYYWVVGDVNNRIYKYTSAGDYTGVNFYVGGRDMAPMGICWDGSNLWFVGAINKEAYKYTSAGDYTGVSFYIGDQDTYPYGICWDGSNFWVVGSTTDKVYQYSSAGVYTGVSFYIGDQDTQPKGITWDGTYLCVVGATNKRVYKYQLLTIIQKKYQGAGYMFMQTDITELVSLLSTDYGSHYELESGDYFEIDFQTSSDSKIELLAYKDGNLQQTLTLSPSENTNFNRHIAQIIVTDSLEFDQLKIRSTFEDTDYMKVYDIKTFNYIITGDYADFWVGSKRTHTVVLTSDDYNMRIFEDGIKKIDMNITIGITDYYYIYEPIESIECRLTLFYIGKENSLEFMDYHISINRSLNGVWDKFDLLANIFSADMDTNMEINVSDQFNTLVYSDIRPVSAYIDLELEIFRLQIKSLLRWQTTVDIDSTYIYPLLSYDSLYFFLSKTNYQIGYYNDNEDYQQFSIYLNSNQAYTLDRSQLCFLSYINQRGEYLEFNQFKTYINGTLLYQNIFYEDVGDTVDILITDLFGYEVYQDIYTVVLGENYIPIILTQYSLKISNQQEMYNHVNITLNSDLDYPATYTFENEIDDTLNDNIEFISSYSSTDSGNEARIMASEDGHDKVIRFISDGNSGTYSRWYHNNNDQTSSCTIELWMKYIDNGAGLHWLYFYASASNVLVRIYFDSSTNKLNWEYGDGIGGTTSNGIACTSDIWHHIRINFDFIAHTYDLYLNGILIADGLNFRMDYTDEILIYYLVRIDNAGGLNALECYLDAVGESWDLEYEIGDNLKKIPESEYYWSEWIAPAEIVKFNLFEGYYIFDLTDNEHSSSSSYSYTLRGDDIILISSDNTFSSVITNILNVNSTIGNLITNVEITLTNINTDINNTVINIDINLSNINSTLGDLLIAQSLTLTNIENNIGTLFIYLNNNFTSLENTINLSFLDLTNTIFLINNTIYTSVIGMEANLNIIGTTILGNLSIAIQQNEFLTTLFRIAMFSELLNWTGAGYNSSYIESQIDTWQFINEFNNQTVQIFLEYEGVIDILTLTAESILFQLLPITDVEYRLWSVDNEEYITEWQPLPENRTVSFGFFETTVSKTPFDVNFFTILIAFICTVSVGMVIVIIIWAYMKGDRDKTPKNTRKRYKRKMKPGSFNNRLTGGH